MYKYAIFDLDGTLANTLEDLADSVNYALKKNGFETYPTEAYKQMVGSGIINLVKRASKCDDEAVIGSLKADFDEYYSANVVNKTCAYPLSGQVLEALQSNGITLAVLSNKPDIFVKAILDKLFPDISFKEAWGKKEEYAIKPNPESLNAMLNKLGAEKSETVYIGDSNVDILTAQNGEIDVIGCTWGFRGENELVEAGADKIAHTYSELGAFILGEAK